MKISQEEVTYVAHLARLNLGAEELVSMTTRLDTILSYFEKLEELDTESVIPTTHVLSITNAFREDKAKKSLPLKDALSGAPRIHEDSFLVPRVI